MDVIRRCNVNWKVSEVQYNKIRKVLSVGKFVITNPSGVHDGHMTPSSVGSTSKGMPAE